MRLEAPTIAELSWGSSQETYSLESYTEIKEARQFLKFHDVQES